MKMSLFCIHFGGRCFTGYTDVGHKHCSFSIFGTLFSGRCYFCWKVTCRSCSHEGNAHARSLSSFWLLLKWSLFFYFSRPVTEREALLNLSQLRFVELLDVGHNVFCLFGKCPSVSFQLLPCSLCLLPRDSISTSSRRAHMSLMLFSVFSSALVFSTVCASVWVFSTEVSCLV